MIFEDVGSFLLDDDSGDGIRRLLIVLRLILTGQINHVYTLISIPHHKFGANNAEAFLCKNVPG